MTDLYEFLEARLSELGTPVYFGPLPQTHSLAVGPAITYTIPDRPFGHHLGGADGTGAAGVEVSAWSLLESTSDALGQAIRRSLDGYAGDVVTICLLQDEVDMPHPPFDSSDQWRHEIRYRYLVNHRVPLPSSLS